MAQASTSLNLIYLPLQIVVRLMMKVIHRSGFSSSTSAVNLVIMRNYFNKNNIQFTELDTEGAALTDFTILKVGGYPLIYIGYRRIIGVNIKLLEETRKEFSI